MREKPRGVECDGAASRARLRNDSWRDQYSMAE